MVHFNLRQGDYVKIQYRRGEKSYMLGGIVLANNNNDLRLIPLSGNEGPERILRIYNTNPRTVVIRKKSITSGGLKEYIPNYIARIQKQIEKKKQC